MNSEQMTYLKEIFGYDTIADVDDLTWHCIEENASDGYRLDKELLQLRDIHHKRYENGRKYEDTIP